MELNEKTILVDVDGVLLDWIGGFEKYMNTVHNLATIDNTSYQLSIRYGIDPSREFPLIEEFNHSEHIGNLLPHLDAVEHVNDLARLGHRFRVITSLSKNDSSCQLRVKNLENVFGKVFDDFVFLDIGESKRDALAKFEGSGLPWVEDLPKNALDGHYAGLKTYLMSHTYNKTFSPHPEIPVVQNWKELSAYL